MYEYQCKMCGATIFSEKTQNNRMFCSKKCYGAFLHAKKGEIEALQNVPDMPKLKSIDDDGFVALVNAIVDRACTDYVKLPLNAHNRLSAERFFLTEYEKLTGFDGREMLNRLDKQRRKRRRKKNAEERAYDAE